MMRRRRQRYRAFLIIIVGFLLFIITVGVLQENLKTKDEEEKEQVHLMVPFLFREVLYDVQPLYSFLARGAMAVNPIEKYMRDHAEVEDIKEYYLSLMQQENAIPGQIAKETEAVEKGTEKPGTDESVKEDNAKAKEFLYFDNLDFFSAGIGFVSRTDFPLICVFEKADNKSKEYKPENLRDYEFVMEHFYTVDASTSPVALKEPDKLLATDCTVDKSKEGPQILIYHTHSQEAFADSVSGDTTTTIMGAGARLAELLREEYGYSVYHHTGTYDVNSRDDAYAVAAPAIEEILNEYPQIQVIIDLHRDGVAENRHLVQEVQGIPMAQFMFFNGLSYSNKSGDLDYLPNEHLAENLALSLKMGIAANEYYPGLVRNNYLNAYRYNMHYRAKTLLIELGAQTNTVEEIMNSCEPLAHVLDMVLSGSESYSS